MSNSPTSLTESGPPKLAPPGAGIPFYHRLMLRLFIGPFVAKKTSWTESEQSFHKISGRILKEIEIPLITAALAATRGNQIKAAELLGLNRNTLRKKVNDLDIRLMRLPR